MDDRIYLRIGKGLKVRLSAYTASVPGNMSDVVRAALSAYLHDPQRLRVAYAVIGADGRLIRLFREREGAEAFVRGLGAEIAPDGSWAHDLIEDVPGEIRPVEIE